jgi:methyltransferase (TIGR00027 family)
MEPRQPSRTALSAATYRAEHQVLDGGRIFADPFACAIAGIDAEVIAADAARDPSARRMRAFVVARSRIAEDALVRAVERGVHQAVVLGAGLDTFGLRNTHSVRVFEVDHPATQAWKRERLSQMGIPLPASLVFAPVDFERESLADGLAQAGFQHSEPAFFMWLGVTPYLTREAIFSTLRFVASVLGSEIVFDYGEPSDLHSPDTRALFESRAARVAAIGEPWISFFEPTVLAAELRRLGFGEIEDIDGAEIGVRFYGLPREIAPRRSGGHVLRAKRTL